MDSQRYDRQIRVWGAEAQQRLQQAQVLLCGLNSLNVEVAKNLVLAGVALTIMDNQIVQESDLACNFFLTKDDLGHKVVERSIRNIQALNTHVKLQAICESIDNFPNEFYSQFDVIVLSGNDEVAAMKLDEISRNNHAKHTVFFWTNAFAEEALFFSDFGINFQYKEDTVASSSTHTPKEPSLRSVSFPSIKAVLEKKWVEIPSRFFPLSPTYVKSRILHKLKNRQENHSAESTIRETIELNGYTQDKFDLIDSKELISIDHKNLGANITSCSILGSFLSQEIVKAVSRVGTPGCNVFVFHGADMIVKAVPIAVAM